MKILATLLVIISLTTLNIVFTSDDKLETQILSVNNSPININPDAVRLIFGLMGIIEFFCGIYIIFMT